MRRILLLSPLLLLMLLAASCRRARMKEHSEWQALFAKHGIEKGCFILKDQVHEAVHFYNKDRCLERFPPASTFKIMNALVALEANVAPSTDYRIAYDSSHPFSRAVCNKDMSMYDAFRESCLPWFQELARRNGRQKLQHYMDTVHYGNANIGTAVDSFWINGALQISADEQVNFVKKLYFSELPGFSDRTQREVCNMMLFRNERGGDYRLSYKTGWASLPNGNSLLWVVGFEEISREVTEQKGSMNKSGVRSYSYFFALNFEVPGSDEKWGAERLQLLDELLAAYQQQSPEKLAK